MAEEENSFLGKGWGFPPTFQKENKQVEMVSDEEDIRQSLEILLSTYVGERVMQPEYGCNLRELLFEPLDTSLQTYILDLVEKAIIYFEPRIRLESASMLTDQVSEGILIISIDFRVRTTNSRFNMVYPFYLNEGTEV